MSTLTRLRELRDRCSAIHGSFASDIKPYLVGDSTFVTLPNEAPEEDASTATTCTGLMAAVLAGDGDVSPIYGRDPVQSSRQAFTRIMDARWDSSGLPPDNAFTSVLVIRASSFLTKIRGIDSGELLNTVHKASTEAGAPARWSNCTLREIILKIADGIPSTLTIEKQAYPATAAFGYWLVDGIDRFGVELGAECWKTLAGWIAELFRKQVSLISANDDTLKDPVALGMAAALVKRLRNCCEADVCRVVDPDQVAALLPSALEVRHAVRLFMSFQNPDSGTWPRFFPLFHFPEGGANYCLSFEVLEALLREFRRDDLFREPDLLRRLECTVAWLETTRLQYVSAGGKYTGWNSGTDVVSLQAGKPELWTTGVVHMFERRLHTMATELIRKELKEKYRATHPSAKALEKLATFIDIEIDVQGESTTVLTLLKNEIVQPRKTGSEAGSAPNSRSALLFGPPGTSKTTLVKGIAAELGWDFVEITPSHFVSHGLPNIYSRANEIFDDLRDMRNVVIFFDEMDALTRTRQQGAGGQPLDVTQQFLTTSMLPKLASLHDDPSNVFFMATNHRRDFDEAIVRPGRFDLLIFMPPPKWKQKLQHIDAFLGSDKNDAAEVREVLTSGAALDSSVAAKLDLFTYAEMLALFGDIKRRAQRENFEHPANMLKILREHLKKEGFVKLVEEWFTKYIALRDQASEPEPKGLLQEFREDERMSRRQ